MKFFGTSKGKTTNFFLLLFSCCRIRDPGYRMDNNQDLGSGINIPDPQH